ncbi:hypothetical protein B0H21DRAFT_724966 [Amylocystis lapponica]|nr:hypothetical protein B0H21DRAFT_724966 [Amylocystis lapponica]
MAARAIPLLLALLPAATYAFADTHPVVAFATYPSTFPSTKSIAKSADTPTILKTILSSDNVCAHGAVILVDQPGLHASDLRALRPDSALASTLGVASDSVQIPYLPRSTSHPFTNLSGSLAQRCGANVISYDPNQPFSAPEAGDRKYVVHMSMPSLEGLSGAARKNAMNALDADLFLSLSKLSLTFQNYVVVYAGWVPSHLSARQSPFEPDNTAHAFAAPSGGVLARYQLLTPGLILALIIAFFVLVPIIFGGISALASIQSPLKTEPPKGFVAEDKKNQ